MFPFPTIPPSNKTASFIYQPSLTFYAFISGSTGQVSLPSNVTVKSGDILIARQVAADASYSTLPNFNNFGGTGFTVAAGVVNTLSGNKVHVANISYKVCNGTETNTTIGGFMSSSTDGYAVTNGSVFLVRPNYTYTNFNVYSTDSVGTSNTSGTITTKSPKDSDTPFSSSSGATIIVSIGLKSGGFGFVSRSPEFNSFSSEFRKSTASTSLSAGNDSGFMIERSTMLVSQAAGEHQQQTNTITLSSNHTSTCLTSAVFEIVE